MSNHVLFQGDCLELMHNIPDKSVDMILCDLPYGTTACKWDVIIPFDKLWAHYERVIKDNGAIVLFGSEPFSSHLRMSNMKMYKYDWFLNKNWVTGHLNAKKQPMRKIEIASVFNVKEYKPQGLLPYNKVKNRGVSSNTNREAGTINFQEFTNYPNNLLDFIRDKETFHPTQKPVALLEYLIKTYTNEGDLVLDNTMGSGSTGVAAMNLNRMFIGIEKEPKYYEIAEKRIAEAEAKVSMEEEISA